MSNLEFWVNEPREWSMDGGVLRVNPEAGTDLWCDTLAHYRASSMHSFGRWVSGDFVVQAKLSGDMRHQYDQVGILIQQDDVNWLKCGVEIIENQFHYTDPTLIINGAYTRNGWSEWSVIPPVPDAHHFWIKIEKTVKSCVIYYSTDGVSFFLMKMCAFPDADQLFVGRYIGSPKEAGFTGVVEDYELREM